MDDKEYYSLMNRSSTWEIAQVLKKKALQKSKKPQKSQNKLPAMYKTLEARQGQADAEMLIEKNDL
jgi:hypothetical protein